MAVMRKLITYIKYIERCQFFFRWSINQSIKTNQCQELSTRFENDIKGQSNSLPTFPYPTTNGKALQDPPPTPPLHTATTTTDSCIYALKILST